ncbi:hypothetical protein [Massilia sp. Se16.2.3]|uniref:hypothetical protein n=1 Tax=Massilia sp. Se16.2.3 TaxID=2709303 RepID=UPI001E480540|nr:hypothetical protein [Massilia sp. Se16.2.3]
MPTVLRLALVENLRRLAARLDARTGDEADDTSLANSIAGLGGLDRIDWDALVENMSALERTLCRDPAGVYGRMDRGTRRHYRATVAGLARRAGRDEQLVAVTALALASASRFGQDGDMRTRHVGHYLVGEGLPVLLAKLGLNDTRPRRRLALGGSMLPGALAALTLLFTVAVLVHAYGDGAGIATLLALGMLAPLGLGELALGLLVLMRAPPLPAPPLPRMDCSAGIPADAAAIVVLSTALDSVDDVQAACRALEAHYLTNRDPQLRFCLLSDFTDAPLETMFGDAELLEEARTATAMLNGRHGEGSAPFLLLHRPRTWSETEEAWIGRGRDHGRLADLHAFLRGGARERFVLVEGGNAGLAALRHVVVLAPGAQLGHDSVRQMVAALAHPLNRPLLDAAGRHVVAGHGLLRPRVVPALPGEPVSRYERVGGGAGSDPLAAALPDSAADNTSDGILASTTSTPSSACWDRTWRRKPCWRTGYWTAGACAARNWRTSRYTFPRRGATATMPAAVTATSAAPGSWPAGCAGTGAGLPPAARWQLFDSLRRSLVAPALLALLVLCWALLSSPAFWSAAALAVFFLPAFAALLLAAADKPGDMLWRQHLANWSRRARAALRQAAMRTAFLPHEAWYSLDAIVRSSWRLRVSRRKLLEWRSPSFVRGSTDVEANWRSMWFAPVLAVGSAVLLTFLHPFALFASAPLLLLWFLSPLLAWWLSLPLGRRQPGLRAGQTEFLAKLARRTWHFFDTQVGPQTNWLAPGRLQEYPQPTLTHATTPTDIGLGLLSGLAAWDFGFIATRELLERVGGAFDSMALLERHRGHFLAGYDTRTLAPLQPREVVTTDSGNLAAHLLTLAGGLEALADAPIAGSQGLDGIRTTLAPVEEHATGAVRPVQAAIERCRAQLSPERCRNSGTLPGPGRLPAGDGARRRGAAAYPAAGCALRAAHLERAPRCPVRRAARRPAGAGALDARGAGICARRQPDAHPDAA